MGNSAKEIRKKMDQIVENCKIFKLNKARKEETQVLGGAMRDLLARSFLFEERLFGRDKDKKAIMKLLLEPKTARKDVSFIPIVGMGGLGKTMLTRLIFNNDNIEKHFDLKLWVCVSDIAIDVKQIVARIAFSALRYNPGNHGIEYLKAKLREHVNKRRYLLVLDDFRNENHQMWLELEDCLLSGGEGSRIIVTTRSEKVAEFVGREGRRYHLGALNRNTSWALFKTVAFIQSEEQLMDSNVVKIGMEIVEKCGGIPFAIRAIGSMLYYENPETEWLSFYKYELSKLSPKEDDFIFSVLKLCYNRLSSRLKACFAFCARFFYKDRDIDIEEMIRLWIAQGFMKLTNPVQCLEDVGYQYFLDLYSRSFFDNLAFQDGIDSKTTCKMQNLMHDLAILVASDDIDRDLNQEAMDSHPNSPGQVSNSFSRSRRKLRTILLEPSHISQKHIESSINRFLICKNIEIVSKFKLLRTLDLSNSGIKIVPSSISKLKHLRYLDLSRNDIEKLPSSFTKLRTLLTLDLSYSGIQILPSDIGKLKRLRFLDISYSKVNMLPDSIRSLENLVTLNLNGCRINEWCSGLTNLVNLKHLNAESCLSLTYMPCGLSQLTNLQTLSYFPLRFPNGFQSYYRAQLSELMQLNSLRGSLTISKLRLSREREYEAANLKEKKHLQSLWLSWACTDEDSDDEGNFCSEETNPGPRMLLEADEDFSASYEASLEALRPHSSLKMLSLVDYGGVSFPSWLPLLKNLQMLTLFRCPKFQYLPPLSQHCSLKRLTLCQMTNLLYVSESSRDVSSHLSSSKSKQPLLSLEHLKLSELPNLRGFWGSVETPSWLLSRKILERLEIFHSLNYDQFLLPLKRFQSLKTLILHQLRHLEYISEKGEIKNLTPLPSLEHLQLSELYNLKGWWSPIGSSAESDNSLLSKESMEIHFEMDNYQNFPTFRRLDRFHLEGISSGLTSMPLFPHLSELTLKNTKLWNPFQLVETMSEKSPSTSSATQAPSFSFLSKLRCLSLVENSNLHFLPHWLEHLTSLESLFIKSCPKLKDLSPCTQYLTALRRLDIQSCREFEASGDDPSFWRPLRSLCFLNLVELSKLSDLPSGIQYATSLTHLKLKWCPEITLIPEWISNLKSLRVLSLTYCLKLASLPEGIREIQSLVKLEIQNCRILLPRCRRNIGQDWYKISHIQEIVLEPSPSKFDDFLSACSELLT